MRYRNRLYTVNKYNRPMFMPENNYYDIGGTLVGLSNKVGAIGGGSKLIGNPMGGVVTGFAGAAGKIGGNLISGGLQSGAGNTIGSVGSTVGSAIGMVNPLLGAAVNAGSQLVGGLVNRAFGEKVNQEALNAANAGTSALSNFVSDAGSFDDVQELQAVSNVGNVYKGGWFSGGKARRKNEELKQQRMLAHQFATRSIDNNVDNLVSDQMNNSLANYAAYGGPLGFGGGALGLMQQNRYFDTIDKRSEAIAGKNSENFVGKPQSTVFADGGLKAAFLDSFGSDPIGAAVRYNQGLEQLAAQEEARQAEAQREAEYADMQKRLLNLETENRGLQAMMTAMPTTNTLPEIPVSSFTPSPATSKRSGGNATWDYVEDQLRKSGKFNDVQIEGIKYNLQRESSLNPDIVGDGGAAFGLGQWHGSRQPKDKSLEGQTKHLIETLSNFDGKEHWIGRGNYEGFMNARTPEEAHYYIAKGYERPRADIIAKVKRDSDMSLRDYNHQGKPGGTNYAFGGELGTNGTDFTNGLLYIDEGGSHESNPLDGVPMGLDPEGIPNLVEEGETVYNDYVFSDRMKVPFFMYKELGLGGVIKKKGKEMSFADASKKLAQESEQRPNDPISKAGLDASLAKLAEIQETERMKKNAEEYMGLEEYACGGKMKKYATGGSKGNLYWGWGEQPNQFVPWTPEPKKDTFIGLTPTEMKRLAEMQIEAKKAQTRTAQEGVKKTNTRSDRNSDYSFGKGANDTETQTIDWSRLENIKPMAITLPEMKHKGIEFSKPLQEAIKSEQERNMQNYMANRVEEEYDPYPTWMRYAPVVGSGVMALTDALGLTNKPDYSYAAKLEAAANRAGYAPDVRYNPIGDYMRYTPLDRQYYINQLQANARATDRAIGNTSSPAKNAALLASGYNTTLSLGNLARQAEEYNRAQYERVKEFNRKTNMFNSQMDLEAAMANARYRQQAAQFGLSGLAQAAALRDQIDARVGAARSANLTNFLTSLGNIGRENFALNQINYDKSRRHGARANGTSYDKVTGKACGGKINRRK